jgi:hypothetical protein
MCMLLHLVGVFYWDTQLIILYICASTSCFIYFYYLFIIIYVCGLFYYVSVAQNILASNDRMIKKAIVARVKEISGI